MTDRTQHVIDAIDGALDDWSIGPDAMRWAPKPEAAEDAPPPTVVRSAAVEHRPGCSIVHEYLSRPPACQCGALDRAALRLTVSRVSFAPAGTPPPISDHVEAHQWVEVLPGDPGFRGGRRPARLGLHPWQAAVLAQTYGSVFRAAAEAISRAMNTSHDEMERLLQAVADLRPMAPERPDDVEDPRARALRLRRERSTGPDCDVTRQRRPRHHGSTTRATRR